MVGGLVIVGIVVAIFVILLRKRRARKYEKAATTEVMGQAPHHPTLTPYRQHRSSDYLAAATHSDTTAGFAGIGAGDMGAYESTAVLPSPTKARREATPRGTHPPAPSESDATSSNVGSGSQTGTASSRAPLSPRRSISTTDVLGLRTEVENLRQVMREIRAERLEPPPEYFE